MSTLRERLLEVIKDSKKTKTAFADKWGIRRERLQDYVRESDTAALPDFESLLRFSAQFPNISLEWLITGRGPKSRNENTNEGLPAVAEGSEKYAVKDELKDTVKQLLKAEELVRALKEKVRRLVA